MSILFVCQGNICRSPAAERLLRRELADIGDLPIHSAGTNALVGHPIDPPMAALLAASSVDTSDFAARQLSEDLINDAELIVTMTRRQRSVVVSMVPQALDRTFTLRELGRLTQLADDDASVASLGRIRSHNDLGADDFDIADPHRRGPAEYSLAYEQIQVNVRILAAWLAGQPNPETSAGGPTPASPSSEIRVLESFREPGPQTNPYIVMLAANLRSTPGIALETFSWRAALTSSYDVFHVHWPEILLSRPGVVKGAAHRLLFRALLRRLRRRQVAVVRTQHNLAPHEQLGAGARRLLARLEQLTALTILINATGTPPATPSALIPHGHYRGWYDRWPSAELVPGRIAFVGLIRPYKCVEQLIDAFVQLPADTPLSLHIAGACPDRDLAERLRSAAAHHRNIDLHLDYTSDQEFVQRVTEAELVALPYRAMYNSGSALAALSLNRPVLASAGQSSNALAKEVGPAWVREFDGDLSGQDLEQAVDAVHGLGGEPDLHRRDWAAAGTEHRAAFGRAVRLRRGRTKS